MALPAALLLLAAGIPAAPGNLPPDTTVLAAPPAGFLLPGCSRPTGGVVEGGWDPGDVEISRVERAVAAKLAELATRPGYSPGTELPDPLSFEVNDTRWQREVVGIVRGGRRIVFINYLPSDIEVLEEFMPTKVCDGGPPFFAAEYDVADAAIIHLAFNSALGGPFWPAYDR